VKYPLSVAVITKNEAANLPAFLDSVAFASQIVLVDGGSSDETVKIARDFGCEVYEEPWRGFGPQKQVAIDHCREEWILLLDADERLPPETQDTIKKIVTGPAVAEGYSLPRKNYFRGKWIKHSGWWPQRLVRLFRRGQGRISDNLVHEGVEVSGRVIALNCPILHYTEDRLEEILKKINLYSSLAAQEYFARGCKSTILGAVIRAKLAFLKTYFIQGGILDGREGLTIALTEGVHKFFKYAKLAELWERKK